jgi:CheY-like chemotaxis protein
LQVRYGVASGTTIATMPSAGRRRRGVRRNAVVAGWANGPPEQQAAYREAGMNDVIPKAIEAPRLAAAIAAALTTKV